MIKVLLIDDDEVQRNVLEKIIAKKNNINQVDVASCGLEAYHKAQNDKEGYHCILTDYYLPNMGGVEFVRKIRSNTKLRNTPVIVYSSGVREDTLRKAIHEGASGYGFTPFEPNEIHQMIDEAIQRERALAEEGL